MHIWKIKNINHMYQNQNVNSNQISKYQSHAIKNKKSI